jgi:hypothetical protein
MPEPRMVLVVWHDATHTDGELVPDGQLSFGTECASVGWLITDHADGVTLAMDRGDDAGAITYRMGFTIPRSYIQEVVPLRTSRRRQT